MEEKIKTTQIIAATTSPDMLFPYTAAASVIKWS